MQYNSELPTSQLLNRAADLIEQRGWSRGGGWNEGEDSPLCLEGGILAAMGITFDEVTDNFQGLHSCPAYAAVKEYLGHEEELWRWNDYRTDKEEIIEVLRHVAVIEATKEADTEAAELDAALERLAALYVLSE